MASKRFKNLPKETMLIAPELIEKLIPKVKENCTTKFNESIDVSFRLNLKQKKDDAVLRTIVNLPNGNGKKIKVAVLCEENKIQEAKDSGAEIYGSAGLDTPFGCGSSKLPLVSCTASSETDLRYSCVAVGIAKSPLNLLVLRLIKEVCVSEVLPCASLFVSDSPTSCPDFMV